MRCIMNTTIQQYRTSTIDFIPAIGINNTNSDKKTNIYNFLKFYNNFLKSEDFLLRPMLNTKLFSENEKQSFNDLYLNFYLLRYGIFRKKIKELSDNFCFRNYLQVYDFINENNYLINIIKEIYGELRKYFTFEEFILDLKESWLSKDSKLAIYIKTKKDPIEAYTNLKSFDTEWWLKLPKEKRKNIFINVEFK